ncbi:hypothetical protein [Enterobacter roggenkampii]|uniref:hypothetical protein n=1 Tax=Enterobacter roggenkampii TaxID=1812935 RepID=UPI00321B9C02
MINVTLKVLALLKHITMRVEYLFQTSFSTTTRDDVIEKIKVLNKERNEIYVRYAVFTKLRRLKENGVVIERSKFFESKELPDEKLSEIYENIEILESLLETEQESAYANKNETVVNLFLLSEKKKYFKCKAIAVLTLIMSAVSVVFLNVPYWTVFIGFALYVLFEVKDQVVSYRVAKGFFGTTTTEAIELIKFIRDNIEDIDSGDGGGTGRKVLNPIKNATIDDTLTRGELPNV